MGAKASKPLEFFTKEELAAVVGLFGAKYKPYASLIKENDICGKLLVFLGEEEFLETLSELGITNRLHKRKLLSEFKTALAFHNEIHSLSSSSCFGTDMSESGRSSSCDSRPSSFSSRSSTGSSVDSYGTTLTDCSEMDSSIIDELENRLSLQTYDITALRRKECELRRSSTKLRRSCSSDFRAPTKKAALVLTDIEGSTNLWEANPIAMRKALKLHDCTIRALIPKHFGYETNTEGDAFAVAFRQGADAIAFALDMQVALNQAAWSEDILSQPWARDDGCGRRGLRVRVSVHYGRVRTRTDPVTGLIKYSGEAMEVAKSVEGIAKGGQVIITYDAWNTAFHLSDTHLGSPLVANMGFHKICHKKCASIADDIHKRILEVAPSNLNIMGIPV